MRILSWQKSKSKAYSIVLSKIDGDFLKCIDPVTSWRDIRNVEQTYRSSKSGLVPISLAVCWGLWLCQGSCSSFKQREAGRGFVTIDLIKRRPKRLARTFQRDRIILSRKKP